MSYAKRILRWKSVLFLLLTGASASLFAQEIERPNIQAGERWKYETRDGWTNLPTSQTERIITAVGAERIEATENGNPATFTADMNPIETPENRFEPPGKIIQFPLSTGKKWSHDGKTLIKSSGMTGRGQYEVTVVGQEKVTVPAGTYDSYKLVMSGYFTTTTSNAFTRTYWYAPSLKGMAKIEHLADRVRWTSVLLEASLKP